MQKLVLYLLYSVITLEVCSQNVGIGVDSPVEKLEVNGGIKLGNNVSTAPGTIRWNEFKRDFEGYNGNNWVSLTGGKGAWGSDLSYVNESSASTISLRSNQVYTEKGLYLGSEFAMIGEHLLVGAYGDYNASGSQLYAGSVRILKKVNGYWNQLNVLCSPEVTTSGSQFGKSIATYGTTFLVGAPSNNVGGNSFQGKAFFYGLNFDGTPILLSSFTSIVGSTGDHFGTSVGLSSNYAIVGAPGYDLDGELSRGAAYIFQKNINNTWTQHSMLLVPGGQEEDLFGERVAISGNTAVVSAPLADYGGVYNAGKVYVYKFINNAWSLNQTLTPPSPLQFDKFGSSLVLKGDTLIIGSIQWNGVSGSNQGKVYVYLPNNGSFQLSSVLSAPDGRNADAFGASVSLYNGRIVVGSGYATVGANSWQGKAYVFKNNGAEWAVEAILTASNGLPYDQFGKALIIGSSGIIVGSPNASFENFQSHGRLYFYEE